MSGVTAYVLISDIDQLAVQKTAIAAMLTHAPFAGLHVSFQEPINHVVELHEALVFAQIILRLAKCIVDLAVGSSNADFAWFLEGVQDLGLVQNSCNA